MSSRGRYSLVDHEMYTLHVESRLAGPLSGNLTIEVSPRERIKNIVNNYLCALQENNENSGLAVFNENNFKLDWNDTIESQGIEQGSKLFIGYDKKSQVIKPIHITVIGISILIIASVLFIVTSTLYGTTGGVIPFDYGIVVDAGSAHTEVFLYQWAGDKDKGTGKVHQRVSCEYEVGIATGTDPQNIISCINNVTGLVPKGGLPGLYLGATAGMRILNKTNPKEANIILTALKYALYTSAVQVKSISIIQGEDEAIFSWITTNFLFHTLKSEEIYTYGALDLGGASTQYAFVTNNKTLANESDVTLLKLYGNYYNVKSASFLCFGYLEAMNRHEALMFMSNGSATLYDPCLPIGYSESINTNDFSEKLCVKNPNFKEWLYNNSIGDELLVTGSGNYVECKENVKKLLNEIQCKKSGFTECMPNINLRNLNMKFTAFSGFYYVVHYLNGTSSLDDFSNSTKIWCNLTWNEIKETQPKSQLEHILRYCFAANYIIELFTTKYSFDSDSWKNISFIKKIGDADIGWSLGYMINATNAIPEESPSLPVISLSIFVPLLILSIFMIIIAVIVVKKYTSNIYFNKHTRLSDA